MDDLSKIINLLTILLAMVHISLKYIIAGLNLSCISHKKKAVLLNSIFPNFLAILLIFDFRRLRINFLIIQAGFCMSALLFLTLDIMCNPPCHPVYIQCRGIRICRDIRTI